MSVTSGFTTLIKISPWIFGVFTAPILFVIKPEEPNTFSVLMLFPVGPVIMWLVVAKNVWIVEYDMNGVCAEKGDKKLFIPFEDITAMKIGLAYSIGDFKRYLPKCTITYKNANGKEDSIHFYGHDTHDVESSIYRAWRHKKIDAVQESLKRRKARR
jgi:hypothetical protein